MAETITPSYNIVKIAYYLKKLHFTGGTKVIAQHQDILRELGHEPYWFVEKVATDHKFSAPLTLINGPEEMLSYGIELLVVNKPDDYWRCEPLARKHGMKLVYLSQGYEIDFMNVRMENKIAESRSVLGASMEKLKWGMKKRPISSLYSSRTLKWCVSPYLMKVLAKHETPTRLVRNNVPPEFHRATDKSNSKPVILSVGDFAHGRKNIKTLYNALELTTSQEFHLNRVTPSPISAEETKVAPKNTEFHIGVDDDKVAGLTRQADIVVSTSLDEGFGLPALEGMATGALCVLSDIGAYRSFAEIDPDTPKDYALFFNPHDASELARVLDAALDNPDKFDHIRNNGLEIASHYTPEKTKEDLSNALQETILHPPG